MRSGSQIKTVGPTNKLNHDEGNLHPLYDPLLSPANRATLKRLQLFIDQGAIRSLNLKKKPHHPTKPQPE